VHTEEDHDQKTLGHIEMVRTRAGAAMTAREMTYTNPMVTNGMKGSPESDR
jgi:hypothetical protein